LSSERVRDKIAASRRKGKWTGGTVPLGYEGKDKKLVVNKSEAETVRIIFDLYLELKSFSKLVAELDRRGIVTKRRDTKVTKYQGGIPFSYGPLAYFLKNRVYLGEVHHGGKWFKGEHDAHHRSRDFRPGPKTVCYQVKWPEGKTIRKRRPALGQALRRPRQPHEPELFQQERRALSLLRKFGTAAGGGKQQQGQSAASQPQRLRAQSLPPSNRINRKHR